MRTRGAEFASALALATVFATSAVAKKADPNWPKVIEKDKRKIVVYQPQLESLDDVSLVARSAVSVTASKQEPVFGAVWFAAKIAVDREDRVVELERTIVSDVKFPDAGADEIAALKKVLEDEIPEWGTELSYDELVASLAAVEKEHAVSEKLNFTPPEILFRTEPTVLVFIDGEPVLRDVDDKMRVVVNTPFLIVKHPIDWYLRGGESWYSADDVMGPWKKMRDLPPTSVTELAEKAISKPAGEAEDTGKPVVPDIVVRTKPAEVIQTDGEPKYEPVKGTDLLVVENSDNNIILDIASQDRYVLIAGRWYATQSLEDGPWRYVAGDKLPADFVNIPINSDLGNAVRACIPGTQEAREAVLENQIPTTATVDRKTATVHVQYDGAPKFEPIEGTSMQYAVNTDKSVLLIASRYYCCDEGVWYESSSASGPWVVSTAVPSDVRSIPPDSPVYNVKYVYIYESTPDVVYVGYTPAYTGSYVYGGCVVYGTGYYYAPWYGYHYYPRPVTYGFAVHYSPYAGWGFAFGMSYGWFTMSVGGYGGYWGPAGYHHGYHHGYHGGHHRPVHHAGARPTPHNVYRGGQGGVRPSGKPSQQPVARPSQRPANNVYADRNGNTYRKQGDNWQQRGKDGWSNDKSRTPQTSRNDLNQQYQSRERASQRTQNYNRAQSRPAGRAGGGGRGRR